MKATPMRCSPARQATLQMRISASPLISSSNESGMTAILTKVSPAPPSEISATVHMIGGAGLTFVSIAVIPDSFELEIKGEADIRICKVAWRAGLHRIGVAFIRD